MSETLILGVVVGVAVAVFVALLVCCIRVCKSKIGNQKPVERTRSERIEIPTMPPKTKPFRVTRRNQPLDMRKQPLRKTSPEYYRGTSTSSSTTSPQPESDSDIYNRTVPSTQSQSLAYWQEKRKMWHSDPSLLSSQSLDFGDPPPARSARGSIQYVLRYSSKKSKLEVTVIRGHNLLAVPHVSTDPYVKLYIVPEMSYAKRKTATVLNDRHPNFNEVFRFNRKVKELQDSELILRVFNADRLARNYFIGEIRLPLRGLESWDVDNTKWRILECFVDEVSGLKIALSVRYSSDTSSLNITVHKVIIDRNMSFRTFAGDQNIPICIQFVLQCL
jgi:hypothetical protein